VRFADVTVRLRAGFAERELPPRSLAYQLPCVAWGFPFAGGSLRAYPGSNGSVAP